MNWLRRFVDGWTDTVPADALAVQTAIAERAETRARNAEHRERQAQRRAGHLQQALDIEVASHVEDIADIRRTPEPVTVTSMQAAAARQHAELLELEVQHNRTGWQSGGPFVEYADQVIASETPSPGHGDAGRVTLHAALVTAGATAALLFLMSWFTAVWAGWLGAILLVAAAVADERAERADTRHIDRRQAEQAAARQATYDSHGGE